MFAAHDDASLGETDFLADLGKQIPAGHDERRCNVLGADVAFREVVSHRAIQVKRVLRCYQLLQLAVILMLRLGRK